MRQTILTCLFTAFIFLAAHAGRISGNVTDTKGLPLPFASILIKGTTEGTTANNEGKYFIQLNPGTYTISAHYVGYQRQEKTITVTSENAT
ncbi:MAG TPA: carboxypeptidase-like regulatory domain-containing protein, partial [Chitinophagaceae bacterium]